MTMKEMVMRLRKRTLTLTRMGMVAREVIRKGMVARVVRKEMRKGTVTRKRNSNKGGIGYEGGNNEKENESLNDIYEDIDNAMTKLAMEGNSGKKGNGGEKGNGHQQENGDDQEGNGCQMAAKIPTVKTPGMANKPANKPGAVKKQ
jgi:predicted DNA-binding transcriptional regulator